MTGVQRRSGTVGEDGFITCRTSAELDVEKDVLKKHEGRWKDGTRACASRSTCRLQGEFRATRKVTPTFDTHRESTAKQLCSSRHKTTFTRVVGAEFFSNTRRLQDRRRRCHHAHSEKSQRTNELSIKQWLPFLFGNVDVSEAPSCCASSDGQRSDFATITCVVQQTFQFLQE